MTSTERSVTRVGIAGTFDVENYGDLLFPLLAKEELARRFGEVEIRPFAYHAKSVDGGWPYRVESVADLPELIGELDALLVGGGFLIRFDSEVAPGYGPPSARIHHPTGYWLTPALLAIARGIPLIWNAPGMHCNEIPRWAEPLMQLAFGTAAYVALRDETSLKMIERFAADGVVAPDTAFGIPRMLPETRSLEFQALRSDAGLAERYIVVQPSLSMSPFVSLLRSNPSWLAGQQVVMLPISPAMGERADLFGEPLPGEVRLAAWPSPLLLAELIGRASAVAGHSYHLMITAATAGVPIFTWIDFAIGKFAALAELETVRALPRSADTAAAFIATLRGEAAPAKPLDRFEEIDRHWDRVAGAIAGGTPCDRGAIGRFLQQLPAQLEERERSQGSTSGGPGVRAALRDLWRAVRTPQRE